MKNFLLAAAIIGGSLFSANAAENNIKDFGCVTQTTETSTTEYLEDGTSITVTVTISRTLCSSSIYGVILLPPIKE